jgi:glycosyltransferase involved in cell wall biosynthesis
MTAAAPARVAYVAYAFPVLTQTFTVREVAALRRRGLDVGVFAVRRDADARLDEEAAGEAARATYLSPARSLVSSAGWLVRRPLRFVATLFRCLGGRYRDRAFACRLRAPLHFALGTELASRLASAGGVTRVHAQFLDAGSTVAFVASRLLDAPFSVANHTAYNPFLLHAKARDAAMLLSVSEFDRAALVRECGDGVATKTHVARVGIDLALWRGVARRPEPGRVLSVGALREKKGHDVLIEAAAALVRCGRTVRLRIAGAGSEDPRLRALAASLGVDVAFLGAASPATVREEMSRAAVFALACRVAGNGDLDGIPVALMEAMAAGVPVVSTRLSGIPELVEDRRTGLLAEPGDAVSLAAALARLFDEPDLAARLASEAATRVAELHDIERTSARLAGLLAERAA